MAHRLPPGQHAEIVYNYVVGYVTARGWRREENESGWWWKAGQSDLITLGEALDKQLLEDGVDVRNGQ